MYIPLQVKPSQTNSGFTLIEMSIVLVVIGLLVGGILTGRDLIDAAAQRALVTQIQKYNVAVNTFRLKYGYLPGDIPDPTASQFGFQARGQYAGQGDGNGFIEGSDSNAPNSDDTFNVVSGETGMLWSDLSSAGLIESRFSSASATTAPASDIPSSSVSSYLPQARMGKNNYLFIWAGGWPACFNGNKGDFMNYIAISQMTGIKGGNGQPYNSVSITPNDAYAIDKKMDDGFPQSGTVTAQFPSALPGNSCWAAAAGFFGAASAVNGGPTTQATAGSSTTCYDNRNVNGAAMQYSLTQSGGNLPNCALSFKFQ